MTGPALHPNRAGRRLEDVASAGAVPSFGSTRAAVPSAARTIPHTRRPRP